MKLFCATVLALAAIGGSTAPAQTSSSYSYSFSSGPNQARKYSYAIVDSNSNSVSCWGQWNSDEFSSLRAKAKGESLFVKRGDDLYVISDKSTVSQAKAAFAPMIALGKKQGDLGKRQGELGKQQGELGRQMGELGREQGRIVMGHETNGKRDSEMKAIQEKMHALSELMKGLGEKQKELGKQQSALGKQQADVSRVADAKVIRLIDDAFAKGLAAHQ